MRDKLPERAHKKECAVINLDTITGAGTHWVAYCKVGADIYYYDSFGNLQPPRELLKYFGSRCNMYYNSLNYQKFGTKTCGQLCLKFLHHFNKRYF